VKTYYIYSAETREMLKVKATSVETAILAYIRREYSSDPEELQKIYNELVGHPIIINSWANDFGLFVTDEALIQDISSKGD
jgi:N6-adenosine-specific RNA methylase IME4